MPLHIENRFWNRTVRQAALVPLLFAALISLRLAGGVETHGTPTNPAPIATPPRAA